MSKRVFGKQVELRGPLAHYVGRALVAPAELLWPILRSLAIFLQTPLKTPVVMVFGCYLSGFAAVFATGCGSVVEAESSAVEPGPLFGSGKITDIHEVTSDLLEVPWYALENADFGFHNGSDAQTPTEDTPVTNPDVETEYSDVSAPNPDVIFPVECNSFDVYANKLKYPLVFAHGAGGFEKVGPFSYFYLIPESLRQQGYASYVAALDPFNTSSVRGEQLADFVDLVLACTSAEKVSIVAHSQGGLDARFLVSTLGYGDRVASITTIATPHHGTAIADIVLGVVPGFTDDIINFVLWFVGNLYTDPLVEPAFLRSMEQFSTAGARRFNSENPDVPGVTIYSWAGRAGLTSLGMAQCEPAEVANPPTTAPVVATLVATWTALGGGFGVPNDGMVTVESAKWGRFRGCIAADHLAEVGQIGGLTGGFPYLNFYLELVEFLMKEGF